MENEIKESDFLSKIPQEVIDQKLSKLHAKRKDRRITNIKICKQRKKCTHLIPKKKKRK